MSERHQDDTPEAAARSRVEREREPRNYYYDDGTGYELYDPEKDDQNEDGENTGSGDLKRPD